MNRNYSITLVLQAGTTTTYIGLSYFLSPLFTVSAPSGGVQINQGVFVKSLSCEDARDFGVGQGATRDDIQAISNREATPAHAKRPAASPEWILQTHPSVVYQK